MIHCDLWLESIESLNFFCQLTVHNAHANVNITSIHQSSIFIDWKAIKMLLLQKRRVHTTIWVQPFHLIWILYLTMKFNHLNPIQILQQLLTLKWAIVCRHTGNSFVLYQTTFNKNDFELFFQHKTDRARAHWLS